jgi:hypothetical protein
MRTIKTAVITLMALCLVGQVYAQNGQVRFKGTVTQDEKSNALAVCYGDTFVEVTVGEVLEDVNHVLVGLRAVDVCYKTAMGLVQGEAVEVYGFYWGGTCPKQYCSRVQIIERTDYILRLFCCPDNDWLVSGEDMHSIPAGKVGIGTTAPDKKLHVRGDVLIDGQALSSYAAPLTVTHQGEGRQLAAYFSNPQDGNVEVDVQWTGGTMLPWGWSLKAASGMFTLGSIMVLPPALNITSTGNVGLGVTSPTYRLELPNTAAPAGRGRANSWTTYSSLRWKTNVQTIDQALDKVRQLRGVTFDWKDNGRHDIGLIAEEVGKVVPEVVDYEANGENATSMDYSRLVALLVEALKEQDARIADLEQALDQSRRLAGRLEVLESLIRRQGVSLEEGRKIWNQD